MGRKDERVPIEFYSAGLNQAQTKYAAGELEAWAMMAAIRRWRTYLRTMKIIIITDHKPLVWLRRQKDPRNKFARWLLELEAYDYEVEYRRGTENGPADFLSWLPKVARDESIEDEEVFLSRGG